MPRTNKYLHAVMLFFLCVALIVACGEGPEGASPCDGFAKKVGITPQEYGPCASEIISTLDLLQLQLRTLIAGRSQIEPEALKTYRHLKYLIREVGIWKDARRGIIHSEKVIERWSDERLIIFNTNAAGAEAQYMSALGHPNEGNLKEGSRLHEEAIRWYQDIW